MRYLYIGHLEPGKRKLWWQVLSRHVNGLSSRALIVRPPVILDDGGERDGLAVPGVTQSPPPVTPREWSRAVLLRVDTYAYGELFAKIWEKLPPPHFRTLLPVEEITTETIQEPQKRYYRDGYGREFYRTELVDREVKKSRVVIKDASAPWLDPGEVIALESLTGSTRPVVYGDWFLWQTAIQNERDPAGYYDFKGIKDEDSYHKIVGFDEKLFKKQFADFIQEARFAQARSDVLKQGRLVKRFETIGGALWLTLDNRKAVNVIVKGKAEFRDPRTIVQDFTFDGTEQFGLQANKLWATYAGDNKGKSLPSAPDFLGGDSSSNHNTKRIEVNLSCLRCHEDGGLKDLKPYHQGLYQTPLALVSPDDKALHEAQELYFRQLQPLLAFDRARYAQAVFECNGLTTKEDARALGEAWGYYDGDVNLGRVCRELGTTKLEFREAVKAYLSVSRPSGDMVLGNWLLPRPESFVVDSWHSDFASGQVALFAYRAMLKSGFKPSEGGPEQQREWGRAYGFLPCMEKGGRLYGWKEACKDSKFDWKKWEQVALGNKLKRSVP